MTRLAILLCALMVTMVSARPGQADALIPPDMIADMQSADVVILGEVHDNPRHHQVQSRGGQSPVALGGCVGDGDRRRRTKAGAKGRV